MKAYYEFIYLAWDGVHDDGASVVLRSVSIVAVQGLLDPVALHKVGVH